MRNKDSINMKGTLMNGIFFPNTVGCFPDSLIRTFFRHSHHLLVQEDNKQDINFF